MQEERIKILYVDDEAKNLTAFKASFRRSYEIATAISAGEAADLLRQDSFHIIIAEPTYLQHLTRSAFTAGICCKHRESC